MWARALPTYSGCKGIGADAPVRGSGMTARGHTRHPLWPAKSSSDYAARPSQVLRGRQVVKEAQSARGDGHGEQHRGRRLLRLVSGISVGWGPRPAECEPILKLSSTGRVLK